jgi:hypothetical protein
MGPEMLVETAVAPLLEQIDIEITETAPGIDHIHLRIFEISQ